MEFNGKTLIVIGSILFFFQLGNFFSIDSISPALERAQVLSAISSVIIILIGFLFKQFNPNSGDKVELKGENKFIFEQDIPRDILDELAWGSEAILTSTAAASILIFGYVFSVMAIQVGELNFTSLFRYSILIFSIFLGMVVFDEYPDRITLLGCSVIIIAGAYTIHREHYARHNEI